MSVPFCMGKLIDLIQVAASTHGMEDTLFKVSVGLSAIFVIGAIANAGRVYLLQISGLYFKARNSRILTARLTIFFHLFELFCFLFTIVGCNIMKRLRERIYTSILAQEIAFFDTSRTGELVNRLAVDAELVSNSVTQNVSDGLRALAQVITGIGMMVFVLFHFVSQKSSFFLYTSFTVFSIYD